MFPSPVISGVDGVAVAVVGRLADGLHPADDAFITVAVVVLVGEGPFRYDVQLS